MGQRKSVYRVKREWAESLPSPNATVPAITVELRVFYPPHMGHEERAAQIVRQVMHEVVVELGQAHASIEGLRDVAPEDEAGEWWLRQ